MHKNRRQSCNNQWACEFFCSFISGLSICTGNTLSVSILHKHLDFLLLLCSMSRFTLWSIHLQSFLPTLSTLKNASSETNDQELIEKLLNIYNWLWLYYQSQTIHYLRSGQYSNMPRKTVFISYCKHNYFFLLQGRLLVRMIWASPWLQFSRGCLMNFTLSKNHDFAYCTVLDQNFYSDSHSLLFFTWYISSLCMSVAIYVCFTLAIYIPLLFMLGQLE